MSIEELENRVAAHGKQYGTNGKKYNELMAELVYKREQRNHAASEKVQAIDEAEVEARDFGLTPEVPEPADDSAAWVNGVNEFSLASMVDTEGWSALPNED